MWLPHTCEVGGSPHGQRRLLARGAGHSSHSPSPTPAEAVLLSLLATAEEVSPLHPLVALAFPAGGEDWAADPGSGHLGEVSPEEPEEPRPVVSPCLAALGRPPTLGLPRGHWCSASSSGPRQEWQLPAGGSRPAQWACGRFGAVRALPEAVQGSQLTMRGQGWVMPQSHATEGPTPGQGLEGSTGVCLCADILSPGTPRVQGRSLSAGAWWGS